MLALGIIACGLTWWLGLYLLVRNPRKAPLRRAALGLLVYALSLAFDQLRSTGLIDMLDRWASLLVTLPALCWSGALIALLPEDFAPRATLDGLWQRVLVPVSLLIFVVAVLAPAAIAASLTVVLGVLVALALAAAFVVSMVRIRALRPAPVRGLMTVVTLFFGLALALLVLPFGWLPQPIALLAISSDMVLFGLAAALWDAFDEGENLPRDMFRSLVGAAGAALIFGSQGALALALIGSPLLLPLLLSMVLAAITLQALNIPLQAAVDRLVFQNAPALQQERADLRAVAEALPRVSDELDLLALDDSEFVRLTRRALSHYGDLSRLASSPLAELPAVSRRLAERGAFDNQLERAAELRSLLEASIERLRPRDGAAFGTSDAWRFYNALYFPYVVGLRPYSRRSASMVLDPTAQQALEWFATNVPERTLHNWQNAAARLVADDLRQE